MRIAVCAREAEILACMEKWRPFLNRPCIAAIFSIAYSQLEALNFPGGRDPFASL